MAVEAVEAVEAMEVMVVQVIQVAIRKKDDLKETVLSLKPLLLTEMETVSILMN